MTSRKAGKNYEKSLSCYRGPRLAGRRGVFLQEEDRPVRSQIFQRRGHCKKHFGIRGDYRRGGAPEPGGDPAFRGRQDREDPG